MKTNTNSETKELSSFKIQRLDEKANELIFSLSMSSGIILHEKTGNKYKLKETPSGTGLILTK